MIFLSPASYTPFSTSKRDTPEDDRTIIIIMVVCKPHVLCYLSRATANFLRKKSMTSIAGS